MSIILQHIDQLTPYALGVRPNVDERAIKLNQNENPYPPSPHVLQALCSIGEETLRVYPDALCSELRMALAAHYGVKEEQIFCGNGSSEIISLIFKVFIGAHRRFAMPDPSFSLYRSVASAYQSQCTTVALLDDFTVNTDLLLNSGADAIVLVNPNAPTGLMVSIAEIEHLVGSFPGLVVIDETYIDFADRPSVLPLINRYHNLLVIRTFSKAYAMCGARVGCCFADEALIAALNKGKDIYNVNAVSQRLALAALLDQAYLEKTTSAIQRTRDAFIKDLEQLGFAVLPSQTNFVLCTPPELDKRNMALYLHNKLLERSIYVRYFDHPRLADKLRISIGTDEEMAVLCAELRQLLACR